jgi:hypothetical protein
MSEGNGEVVSVRILPNDSGNPKGKLADAEVIFGAGTGPLQGLRLIGFGVWERRDGGRNVTFPASRSPLLICRWLVSVLDTALKQMNTAEHQFAGRLLHDRIIGAIDLVCRRGEMLLIQNRRVNWDTCQIGIPGATTKDKENRRMPSTTRVASLPS